MRAETPPFNTYRGNMDEHIPSKNPMDIPLTKGHDPSNNKGHFMHYQHKTWVKSVKTVKRFTTKIYLWEGPSIMSGGKGINWLVNLGSMRASYCQSLWQVETSVFHPDIHHPYTRAATHFTEGEVFRPYVIFSQFKTWEYENEKSEETREKDSALGTFSIE